MYYSVKPDGLANFSGSPSFSTTDLPGIQSYLSGSTGPSWVSNHLLTRHNLTTTLKHKNGNKEKTQTFVLLLDCSSFCLFHSTSIPRA